jgi:hypothetical protein
MKEFKDLPIKQKYDILQTAIKAQLKYYKEDLGRIEEREIDMFIGNPIYSYNMGRKQVIEQVIESFERWAEE